MKIDRIQAGHYLIPLPVTLADATQGEIKHFTLITARIFCASGEGGVGYTYTVGEIGGTAAFAMLERDLVPSLG